MGVALAREAYRRGADVMLVHGPVSVRVPSEVACYSVVDAVEMHETIDTLTFRETKAPDVVIMAAAVADFRPTTVRAEKIKKSEGCEPIAMTPNVDILSALGEKRGDSLQPMLVGFAVETGEIDELLDEVRGKLDRKNVDMIVGNMADDAFDKDTNRVWLVDRTGRTDEVLTTYKSRIAVTIFDSIRRLL
jgi:phosphopantothenoylcysteine decarboxylase/phosphopantothenate--cysteine ligase